MAFVQQFSNFFEIMSLFVLMYTCLEPQCTKRIKVKLFQSNTDERPRALPSSFTQNLVPLISGSPELLVENAGF